MFHREAEIKFYASVKKRDAVCMVRSGDGHIDKGSHFGDIKFNVHNLNC